MSVIYQQKQKSNMFILMPFLFMVIISVYFFYKSYRMYNNNLIFLWFIVLIIFLCFFISFKVLTFKIKNNRIEFGFGIFRKSILKDQIKSIFVESSDDYSSKYGIITKKDINAYIAQKSDGLIITTKNNLQFFITLDSPEEALDILKQNKYV